MAGLLQGEEGGVPMRPKGGLVRFANVRVEDLCHGGGAVESRHEEPGDEGQAQDWVMRCADGCREEVVCVGELVGDALKEGARFVQVDGHGGGANIGGARE
jgi:hypothetical protein